LPAAETEASRARAATTRSCELQIYGAVPDRMKQRLFAHTGIKAVRFAQESKNYTYSEDRINTKMRAAPR